MKIAVCIGEGPYNHEAADSAYHFIRAALDRGHQIQGIFFYHDGVHNVNALMEPPQDERHMANRWSALGATGIHIVACVTAAKRRGAMEQVAHVELAGLGQLAMMTIQADRLVCFGD
ncbi:MAG: sulfurtransferase complex subunit TusD [Magnetococcales bacterium]|nr:sulfurtransferase complex subunit TusD [Magnetococcales bacterium]